MLNHCRTFLVELYNILYSVGIAFIKRTTRPM